MRLFGAKLPSCCSTTHMKNIKEPEAIKIDPREQILSRQFNHHARMVRSKLTVKSDLPQAPAREDQIFALRKSGMDYMLARNATSGPLNDKIPHGFFAFAIKASDPKTVLVSKHVLPCSEPQPMDDIAVEGHTSITHGAEVLYAGTLMFSNGALKSWSNDSGHYRPDADRRKKALTGYNQQLLPDYKFLRHR